MGIGLLRLAIHEYYEQSFSPEYPTEKLKSVYKVLADIGAVKLSKKKFEEMNVEFKPLTKLMKEVVGEVVKATTLEHVVLSVFLLSARSQRGLG